MARQALMPMCVSHFPNIPSRIPATRQVRYQPIPFAQHSPPSVPSRPHLTRGIRLSGRGERATGSAGAARRHSQPGDAAVHRPGRSTQRRTNSGLVRLCSGRRNGTAPGMATGSSLVPGLRGRRGDRVHRRLFCGGEPGFGQSPAGRRPASALRGTSSAVPQPGLAPASAHRLNRCVQALTACLGPRQMTLTG